MRRAPLAACPDWVDTADALTLMGLMGRGLVMAAIIAIPLVLGIMVWAKRRQRPHGAARAWVP